MSSERSEPNGLLLLLKKRRLELSRNDTESSHFHYLMFGSFDALEIRPIRRWEEQLPSYELDCEASGIYQPGTISGFQEIPYVSSCILRALKPKNEPEFCSYPAFLRQSSRKPFLALVLLNFSGNRCRSSESPAELTGWFAEQLRGIVDSKVECALYETLGYYDEILLLRSASPKPLHDCCTRIRKLLYEGRKAVSSCYAVLGLQNRDLFSEARKKEYDRSLIAAREDIEAVSLFLETDLGGPPAPFARELPKSSEIRIMLNGSKDSAAAVAGAESAELFKAYFSGGILNPARRHTSILSADTHVYTAKTEDGHAEEKRPETDDDPDRSGFWDTYRAYTEKRRDAGQSLRLATALRQTVLRYQNLTANDRCCALKKLLNPVFQTLYQNMKCINELPKELFGMEFWNSYDTAVKDFRDLVGRFISDLALSDTHFLEDSQLKHPSVGTATKFIFAYQYLAQKLIDAVNREENNSYHCLVKSGGRDEIHVTNLFNGLWNGVPEEYSPTERNELLVIDMPERVLYDVRTAIFSLLHEVFHVVGDRKRGLRAYCLCDAMAVLSSDYLIKAHDWAFILTLCDLFRPYLDRSELIEAAEISEPILREQLRRDMLRSLTHEQKNTAGRELLSFRIADLIQEQCGQYYDKAKISEIGRLELQALRSGVKMLEQREASRGRYPSRYMLAGRIIRDWADAGSYAFPGGDDSLGDVVLLLLGKSGEYPDVFTPSDPERMKELADFLAEGIPSALEMCLDVMCEGYSDIMAIRTLGMNWTDYVIALISSREADPEGLLPETAKTMLRLGCVFSCEFRIRGELRKEEKKKLIKRLRALPGKSGCGAADAEQTAERLSRLLKECSERYGREGGRGIMLPICRYLKAAAGSAPIGFSEEYRQLVSDIRSLASETELQRRKEIIMDCWLKLVKENGVTDERRKTV